MLHFDVLIRSGLVVDGTGAAGRHADIGVRDGKVAAVGRLPADAYAQKTIDANGCWVTPGFIDIHTHYDAQVTWDSDLRPSTDHGVTTLVMGNCGVGFAPVAQAERHYMIRVMEGVEDIPGSVLSDGIVWNWESFPQYLDFLADRRFAADVASQVPYSALRVYAMGQAGKQDGPARAADLQRIEELVREALAAGAVGISISRVKGHQVADGSAVPGTEAPFEELAAIARGMNAADSGVFQLVPSGFLGDAPGMGLRRDKWLAELTALEAAEYGVTCNAIAPGLVATLMSMGFCGGNMDELRKVATTSLMANAMRAVLEPVDIASAIGFLCHPAARYITARTFHINGGSLMP